MKILKTTPKPFIDVPHELFRRISQWQDPSMTFNISVRCEKLLCLLKLQYAVWVVILLI